MATNAGGPHCLAYGCTSNHILGLQVVLPDGTLVEIGGEGDRLGFDLTGLFVGSEGTLGIVTRSSFVSPVPLKASVPLSPASTASPSLQRRLHHHRPWHRAGRTGDDGPAICRRWRPPFTWMPPRCRRSPSGRGRWAGGRHRRDDRDRRRRLSASTMPSTFGSLLRTQERAALWAARKGAAGAMGRLAPNYYIQDGVVPRTGCPRLCSVWRKYRPGPESRSRTSSTRATAICIPASSLTAAMPARSSAR